MSQSELPESSGAPLGQTNPGHGRGAAATAVQLVDTLGWEEAAEVRIDLRALAATLFRNRIAIAAILAFALALGLAAALLLPRKYQAHASVQIDQKTAKVLGTEDTDPIASGLDAERFLQTQVDIINSRALAKRVSDKLALAANDAFLSAMHVNPALGSTSNAREAQVLDTLQNNLKVDLPRNSRVVGIAFVSRDPDLATKIVGTYQQEFIASNIERKVSTTEYSRKFLQGQLAQAKERLEDSERKLIAYARSAGIVDASAGARQAGQADTPRSIVTAQLVALNDAMSNAKAARVLAEERWREAAGRPVFTLPDVLNNPAAQTLLQRRAELNANLFQLEQRLKPDHPTVLQAQAQVQELNAQLEGLGDSIRRSIKGQYDVAVRQEQAIGAQVERLKADTLAEQDRGVQYTILKRVVDTNRQMYEQLFQRFSQLSAEAGITSNNITVVDAPEYPRKPVSPRMLFVLGLAFFAGLACATVYVFVKEYFDDAIRDPQDVVAKLGLPLLGVVPKADSDRPAALLEDAKSSISEAYNSVRMSIELSAAGKLPKSLLVTSGSKSEGKSTTSFSLARLFAKNGRKVLLIDADLRRPSIHKLLGMANPDAGLSTCLAGISEPTACTLKTEFENIDFLPCGPLPPDPAMLLNPEHVRALIRELSTIYELVILDAPPVLALADAIELAAASEASVFVVEAASSHLGQTRSAVSRLQNATAGLRGAIVTKYHEQDARYYSYYKYYDYEYRD